MEKIKSQIESLLFVSGKPMVAKHLAELTEQDIKTIQLAGDSLVAQYKEKKYGTQIIKNNNKYQMVSAPENAKIVQKLIKNETTGELSRPSMETLTIIAYRGPVSKIDLERIRGVNCSLIIKNLLLRGLIEVKEDKEKQENYYNVSFDFIRFLGINDIKELPEYEKLSQDDSIDKAIKQ